MNKFLTVVALAVMALGWGSCSKKESLDNIDDILGLGGDTWVQSDLDKWIYDTLTVPYNISAKYKWDQFEFDLGKMLVPPKEDVVKPVLQSIKKVWIDTYIAEAGLDFFNTYSPKFLILAGSPAYNNNGSITLGTAEGGRKVVLYKLNDFRTRDMPGYVPNDSFQLKEMFHVIEHEFTHILNQTINYAPEFKQITTSLYRADWTNVSDAQANQDGFVSAYAMSAYDEDFAEMTSIMLTEGTEGFDAIINSIPAGTSINGTTQAEAVARLRQKEAIVVDYFKSAYGIDFYALQARKRAAIKQLTQ
jgi:substrate import-associated zinc metallohydrolase lipoprotein